MIFCLIQTNILPPRGGSGQKYITSARDSEGKKTKGKKTKAFINSSLPAQGLFYMVRFNFGILKLLSS
jgi:hypothetical protein